MKIKNIRIKNFVGIEELDLEFTHPHGGPLDMIVLAGPNGCGKTSVLEACLMLLNRDLTLYERDETHYMHKGAEQFEISATLLHDNEEYNVSKTSLLQGTGDMNTTMALRQVPVGYFSSWRYPKLVGSVSLSTGEGMGNQNDENERLRLLKQYLINLIGSRAFQDPTASSKDREAFERINELWRHFYPSRNERFVGKQTDKEDVSKGFDIYLEGRAKGPIPLDSLSSGEIEVFTFIGDGIIAPLKDGIFLVDEPELHLHPSWHRAILRVLRKALPGTQIICATHSPEILDSVYSYERFTLLSEQDPRIRFDKSGEP